MYFLQNNQYIDKHYHQLFILNFFAKIETIKVICIGKWLNLGYIVVIKCTKFFTRIQQKEKHAIKS